MNTNARNTDPETSHLAADSITGNTLCERADRFLRDNDRPEGWIQAELAVAMGLDPDMGIWKRLSDLHNDGRADWVMDEDGRQLKRIGHKKRLQGAHHKI